MATEGSQRQDICEGCDFTEVTHICDTCPMYLCDRCTESHKRVKSTKTHSLRKSPNQETYRSAEPVPTYCSAHPGYNVSLYCDTCDDILCSECHKSSHRKHTVVPIAESKQKMQKLCIEYLSKLFDVTSNIKSDDKEGTIAMDRYESGLHNVKEQLKNRKQQLQSCIETTYMMSVAELDTEITRMRSGFDDMVRQKRDNLSKTEQLDVKLGSGRRHDDIDSIVSALTQFKLVYPQIQNKVNLDLSSLLSYTPENLLQPNAEVDETIVMLKRILSTNIKCGSKSEAVGKPKHNPRNQDMLFHEIHGTNIRLSENRRNARRTTGFNRGVCVGSRPISINERIYIQVTETTDEWSGAVIFGLTSLNPNAQAYPVTSTFVGDLNKQNSVWFDRKHGTNTIVEYNKKGAEIFLYVNPRGEVMFGVDGEEKGMLFDGVKTNKTLWPIIDIYGQTVAMEFVKI